MKHFTVKDLIWFTVLTGSLWLVQTSKLSTITTLQEEVNRLKRVNQYVPSTLTIYEP